MDEKPRGRPINGARRRGRPRVEQPLSAISTRMPTNLHDKLVVLANKHEVSVSALVRQMLMLQLGK